MIDSVRAAILKGDRGVHQHHRAVRRPRPAKEMAYAPAPLDRRSRAYGTRVRSPQPSGRRTQRPARTDDQHSRQSGITRPNAALKASADRYASGRSQPAARLPPAGHHLCSRLVGQARADEEPTEPKPVAGSGATRGTTLVPMTGTAGGLGRQVVGVLRSIACSGPTASGDRGRSVRRAGRGQLRQHGRQQQGLPSCSGQQLASTCKGRCPAASTHRGGACPGTRAQRPPPRQRPRASMSA